jgi:hypothetical protein
MNNANNFAPRQPPLPRLHSIILNNCQINEPPFESFLLSHDQFIRMAANGGAHCQIGTNDLQIRVGCRDGSATVAVVCNENSAALAVMAWTKSGQEREWEELMIEHNQMPADFRQPLPNPLDLRPDALPWIGISLAQNDRSTDRQREIGDM